MSCSCNNNRAVKPYETCIFCGHKHIVAALAIRGRDHSTMGQSYAIGQLILAAWHYNSNFQEMQEHCLEIIRKYESPDSSDDLLNSLCIDAWNLVVNNQNSKQKFSSATEKEQVIPFAPDIIQAHRAVAAANALCHELNYKSINSSVTIGQLILAAWHYDKEHHDLALKCRSCWLKVERLQDCQKELASLQESAWRLVVQSF